MYDRVNMRLTFSRATRAMLVLLALVAAAGPASAEETGHSSVPRLATMRLGGPPTHPSYVATTEDGGLAALTIDPRLQQAAEGVLKGFQIPFGAVVVLSVPDARVLALVGRSAVDPRLGPEELALRPWAPAASVFKVVSAAALVGNGVSPQQRTCYHGGASAVLPENLADLPDLDRRCDTLARGLGKSQNAILAKLAAQHLSPELLESVGHALGFEQEIPFELPVVPSHLDVPADRLEFARTAAGFWHSTLSPMHGALLAATIASGGEMLAPRLVDHAVDAWGREIPAAAARPTPPRRVVDAQTAHEVGRMMELTTRIGTARRTFRDKRGRRVLPVEVAGKTGTLSAITDRGYVGYSWFVGFAPADRPAIAFAVVLGNAANWRIKATYVGRRIVTEYLAGRTERRDTPRDRPTRLLAAR